MSEYEFCHTLIGVIIFLCFIIGMLWVDLDSKTKRLHDASNELFELKYKDKK